MDTYGPANLGQSLITDGVIDKPSFATSGHDTLAIHQRKMTGHGRLGRPRGLNDVIDRAFLLADRMHDTYPHRFTQNREIPRDRLEDPCKLVHTLSVGLVYFYGQAQRLEKQYADIQI